MCGLYCFGVLGAIHESGFHSCFDAGALFCIFICSRYALKKPVVVVSSFGRPVCISILTSIVVFHN